MRKRLVCLLVAVLLLTQIISVDREIANASQEIAEGTEMEETDQGDSKEEWSEDVTRLTGEVDVAIKPALILEREVPFTVSLNGVKKEVSLEADGEEQKSVRFSGLMQFQRFSRVIHSSPCSMKL